MSLLRILSRNTLKTTNALTYKSALKYSSSTKRTTKFQNAVDEEVDQPIPYSKSPASKWQAKSSRIGTDSERLWYEPYVAIGSIAVFMIYFCVLREENDIDKEFDKSLYSRIQGLEERQLILTLKHKQDRGLNTKDVEQRLQEIAAEEKK